MSTRVQSLTSLSSVDLGSCVAVSYGVGHRHSLVLLWLWLWCRLAVVALIGPLAGEHPYAPAGVALKCKKKTKKQTNKTKQNKKCLSAYSRKMQAHTSHVHTRTHTHTEGCAARALPHLGFRDVAACLLRNRLLSQPQLGKTGGGERRPWALTSLTL